MLTYLGRVDFDVADDVLAYASVSTGLKSGIIDNVGRITGPETLTNYEIGAKTRFLDRRMTLTLHAIYDFKGSQIGQIEVTRNPDGTIRSSTIRKLNA